jgi:hypothetical protein
MREVAAGTCYHVNMSEGGDRHYQYLLHSVLGFGHMLYLGLFSFVH